MVSPFRIGVPDAVLDDLRERLARTRLAGAARRRRMGLRHRARVSRGARARTGATSTTGARAEAMLNACRQFVTEIDGTHLHFIHARSPHPDALPLVVTHGWPGSVVEFLDIIGPLTDPPAHGGDPADAFHVVCPSMPGYAWSGPHAPAGLGHPAHRRGVRRAHGRARLRALRRAGRRLGSDDHHADSGSSIPSTSSASTSTWSWRGPPHDLDGENLDGRASETELAALGDMNHFREARDSGTPSHPGHQAADDRLRPRRLTGRARGLDRREVPHLERLRRRRRVELHQGSAPRQHHRCTG